MTVAELREALAGYDGALPVVVAIGKGRMLAPLSATQRAATPGVAAGYYVLHDDQAAVQVVVIVETPRTNPPI